MSADIDLYLASASPRRRELLDQVGLSYDVIGGLDVDEARLAGETPDEYVLRLACAKARAGHHALPVDVDDNIPVLGADTCITVDGDVLGKPADRADGLAMLARLSGRSHEVLTAICLQRGVDVFPVLSRTVVTLAELTPAEIEDYWDSGEPVDKAGAYAIQGRAARFITRLEGSYSAVVGLPLYELNQLLKAL